MRIDKLITEKFGSRNKATWAIEKGLILVNGKSVKASYDVKEGDEIKFLEAERSFVSVGGFKLQKAIDDFSFNVKDKVFIDVGASTGGFTDCLLQNGAKKVYCIDVGESLLDKTLDRSKLVVIDNFNARNLDKNLFMEELDGAVIDVSFISLTYIFDGVAKVLPNNGEVLALIKPQFECESKNVGKNGILKDLKQHRRIVEKIYNYAVQCNLMPQKITTAPMIKGKNIEYVFLLKKNAEKFENLINIIKSVNL